ncbi:hypothetical protein V8C37DRAFT_80052 [Trichoderma ceciliae]
MQCQFWFWFVLFSSFLTHLRLSVKIERHSASELFISGVKGGHSYGGNCYISISGLFSFSFFFLFPFHFPSFSMFFSFPLLFWSAAFGNEMGTSYTP